MTGEEKAALFALSQAGAPYVYGGTGKKCTPGYRRARMRQYPRYADMIRENCPVLSGKREACAGCPHQGRPCFDCAQLVRLALKAGGVTVPSGASSMWCRGGWAEKGALDGKEIRGVHVLFRAGGSPMKHTGLALGDGRCVDARGHRTGVRIGAVSDYPWTHYAVPKWTDEKEETQTEKKIDVLTLQKALLAAGLRLPRFGADGKWGGETRAAMRLFQEMNGLPPTDAPDESTLKALMGARPVAARLSDLEKRVAKLEGKEDTV